jgi:hypothetical protein
LNYLAENPKPQFLPGTALAWRLTNQNPKPQTPISAWNSSGLEIDKHCGGILVNNEMLAQTDIYVAGDTASYPDPVNPKLQTQSPKT